MLNIKDGQLVTMDVPHALDKDTRTLFAADNRKKQPQQHDVPELHLLSYYGDITGPKELNLRKKCLKLISKTLSNNRSKYKQNPQRLRCQSMFEQHKLNIMHISHKSIEFILNITNTSLLDEYKLDDNKAINEALMGTNKYLVATYQQIGYVGAIDKLITMGITTNIAYTDNIGLFNFYVDDFIQDLYKILCDSSWYDASCQLPSLLFYIIAQYTMDCILPVTYTRSDDDQVKLDEGLHLFLSGCLRPHDDVKHDMTKLECIGRILCELGQIVYTEYHSNNNVKKLKTEYNKWKKHGFKKRKKYKPSNMRAVLKLQLELRNHAQTRQSINDLKCLYYKNPNFPLKFKNKRSVVHSKASSAQPSTMQSLRGIGRNILSFRSSNKDKHYPPQLAHKRSQSADDMINRAMSAPYRKDNNKKKNKSELVLSSSTDIVGWKAAASVYVVVDAKSLTGNKNKKRIKRNKTRMYANKDIHQYNMDPNDGELHDVILNETRCPEREGLTRSAS